MTEYLIGTKLEFLLSQPYEIRIICATIFWRNYLKPLINCLNHKSLQNCVNQDYLQSFFKIQS
jgi:hypothetical protein